MARKGGGLDQETAQREDQVRRRTGIKVRPASREVRRRSEGKLDGNSGSRGKRGIERQVPRSRNYGEDGGLEDPAAALAGESPSRLLPAIRCVRSSRG